MKCWHPLVIRWYPVGFPLISRCCPVGGFLVQGLLVGKLVFPLVSHWWSYGLFVPLWYFQTYMPKPPTHVFRRGNQTLDSISWMRRGSQVPIDAFSFFRRERQVPIATLFLGMKAEPSSYRHVVQSSGGKAKFQLKQKFLHPGGKPSSYRHMYCPFFWRDSRVPTETLFWLRRESPSPIGTRFPDGKPNSY